jgi:DNA-binding NarL/FixJ family response regulator
MAPHKAKTPAGLEATLTTEVRDPPKKKRILLVDDHPITRQGMKTLIDAQSDLEVCGEASTAPEAVELFTKLRPDLAIIDIALKTSNGIELTKNLKALVATFPVLVVSMHDETLYAERFMPSGPCARARWDT